MIERAAIQEPSRLEEALQNALNHALAHGDDQAAIALAMIFRGFVRCRARLAG